MNTDWNIDPVVLVERETPGGNVKLVHNPQCNEYMVLNREGERVTVEGILPEKDFMAARDLFITVCESLGVKIGG